MKQKINIIIQHCPNNHNERYGSISSQNKLPLYLGIFLGSEHNPLTRFQVGASASTSAPFKVDP